MSSFVSIALQSSFLWISLTNLLENSQMISSRSSLITCWYVLSLRASLPRITSFAGSYEGSNSIWVALINGLETHHAKFSYEDQIQCWRQSTSRSALDIVFNCRFCKCELSCLHIKIIIWKISHALSILTLLSFQYKF